MKSKLQKLLSSQPIASRKARSQKAVVLSEFSFECELYRDDDVDNHLTHLTRSQAIIESLDGQIPPTSARGVRRLVALAVEVINEIERLCNNGNRHIQEVARTRIDWPVLTGHHSAVLKRNSEMIKRIGLAKDSSNNILLTQFPGRTTLARTQTLHLLELVDHIEHAAVWRESIHEDISQCDDSFLKLLRLRLKQGYIPTMFRKVILTWPLVLKIKQLPPLANDANIIKEWQDTSLQLLSLNCNNDPSSVPELCPIGEHRRFHPYPPSVDRDLREKLVTPDKQLKNISREIRDIIKDEIRKIAEHIGKAKNKRPAKSRLPQLQKSRGKPRLPR